jgi:hypothetical protein
MTGHTLLEEAARKLIITKATLVRIDPADDSAPADAQCEKLPMASRSLARLLIFALLMGGLALLIPGSIPHAAAGPAPIAKLDYNFQIRPLLADRCFVCHGPDANKRKAKLRLDQPESALGRGVIVPGRPDESPVMTRITSSDAHEHMPPAKSNLSLSQDEIALIRRWIAEGAEYKPHWAFQPLPDSVHAPDVTAGQWPRNLIDRFILARLEREGLQPSSPASEEDWLRRATFDLTGLPPALADVDAFLADRSPQAFEKAVDRLLASPRYGERLALEWLDVARYADSFGYHTDSDSNVWPWRDWVIDAFNQNMPFDQFVTWQLAGDLLKGEGQQGTKQRLATAFCRLNRMTNEGGSIPEEFRNEYVSDRVHTFGTAFLGLTLECTRCHDHKYDPLTMKDYYSLGAFFNNIDEWGVYDTAAFLPTPTLLLPTPAQEKSLAALTQEVKAKEANLYELTKKRESAFKAWLACLNAASEGKAQAAPEIPGLVGYYPLDQIGEKDQLENLADVKNPGNTSRANVLTTGKLGQALQFSGDDAAKFPNVLGSLERTQPFTVAFWLRTPEELKKAVIFHRQGGHDTGNHGTELSLDDGRLFFALLRFWPGNAMAVRARASMPRNQWVHVAVSYDASGKAAGLRIFMNGQPAEVEVVRDNLYKNMDAAGAGTGLQFGQRERSAGLKGGLLDELRVYARPLSPVEVAQLEDNRSLATACAQKDESKLRPYYFAALDPEVLKARENLRQARERLFNAQNAVFEVVTMKEMAEPRQAYLLTRGAYDAPKDKPVGRNTPAVLPAFGGSPPRDRLELARWLTNPRHPLTARVAVNRYWQLFFGRGLVATTENFGSQGALPTHPELLDWLARDFIASGWDVKRLCKQMVLSATYLQRSAADQQRRERDPDNLLLAHGPNHRLSAEMLRDAALAAGGLMVERLGGPPARPYQPPGLWKGQNPFLPEYVPDTGLGLYRRSLYTFWRRTSPPPNMLAFDAPSREVCVVRRQTTSTPLQPFVLLNDPQFVEAAHGLGEELLNANCTTLEERLAFAFRRAATRAPTARELHLLVEMFREQLELFKRDPSAAQKFLKIGNLPASKTCDPVELAAAAATASAILNLDASLTVR